MRSTAPKWLCKRAVSATDVHMKLVSRRQLVSEPTMTKLLLSHAPEKDRYFASKGTGQRPDLYLDRPGSITLNTMQLFELAGAEDARKTSPFCWRIRFALRHKKLQFDSLPWRRVEKERLAATGQGKVPVLIDGDRTLHDSWKIAEYLDTQYPDLPLLFFGDTGKENVRLTGQTIRFTVNWVDHGLLRALRNIISHGSIEVSAEKDKEFYTNKLQTVHGVDLPTVGASEQHLSHLNGVLEPMRLTLQTQDYLGGSSPTYADFAAAGAFAWARSVSPIKLLEESDPLYIWRARVFEQFHHDLTETIGYPL